jgi:DNA replication licensing factor MCM2
VILLGDLIDIARPGEEVEVTGIYRHTQGEGRDPPLLTILIDTGARAKKKNGFPVFSTTIEANYIQRKGGNINADISEEDRKLIVRMSQDPQVIPERSLSPSL